MRTLQEEVLFINSKATVLTGRVVPESNECNELRERERVSVTAERACGRGIGQARVQ